MLEAGLSRQGDRILQGRAKETSYGEGSHEKRAGVDDQNDGQLPG